MGRGAGAGGGGRGAGGELRRASSPSGGARVGLQTATLASKSAARDAPYAPLSLGPQGPIQLYMVPVASIKPRGYLPAGVAPPNAARGVWEGGGASSRGGV